MIEQFTITARKMVSDIILTKWIFSYNDLIVWVVLIGIIIYLVKLKLNETKKK